MLPLTISGSSRPRVLVADDHLQVLESVSSFLSTDFDVVATASDGREAVDLALRFQPDIAVLDMAMPGLDGFQTVEELKRHGSPAKPVFLTMHGGDEFIKAAIEAGALGYVLKSRIYEDLFSAIGHALHGRLFAPSLTALSAVSARGRHTTQFHNNDRFFLDELSQFVGATLRLGEPVVLATNETIRVGVAERLQAGGFALESSIALGSGSLTTAVACVVWIRFAVTRQRLIGDWSTSMRLVSSSPASKPSSRPSIQLSRSLHGRCPFAAPSSSRQKKAGRRSSSGVPRTRPPTRSESSKSTRRRHTPTSSGLHRPNPAIETSGRA